MIIANNVLIRDETLKSERAEGYCTVIEIITLSN